MGKLSTEKAKWFLKYMLDEHLDELAGLYGQPKEKLSIESWVRKGKGKKNGRTLREFQHRDDVLLVAYTYSDGLDERFLSVGIGKWGGTAWINFRQFFTDGGEEASRAIDELLRINSNMAARKKTVASAVTSAVGGGASLAQNPIKVQLKIMNRTPDCTGKIGFWEALCEGEIKAGDPKFDESCLARSDGEYNPELFGFTCGPIDRDGSLSDQADCYDSLRELFADFGDKIDIGAAENEHLAMPVEGLTPSALWAVIKARLLRSGAVLMQEQE